MQDSTSNTQSGRDAFGYVAVKSLVPDLECPSVPVRSCSKMHNR